MTPACRGRRRGRRRAPCRTSRRGSAWCSAARRLWSSCCRRRRRRRCARRLRRRSSPLGKMRDACARLEQKYPMIAGRVWIGSDAAERVRAAAAAAAHPQHDVPGAAAAASAAAAAARAPRTVVAVLALPPGGGKTPLCSPRRRRLSHPQTASARAAAISTTRSPRCSRSTSAWVRQERRTPTGLRKLIKVVAAAQRRGGWDVRLVVVVPDRIDHDLSWGAARARGVRTRRAVGSHRRRRARGVTDLRSVFYDACLARPAAAALPGAVTSAAFWESVDAAHALARQLAAPDLPRRRRCSQRSRRRSTAAAPPAARAAPTAAAAELPRTRLHLTLVPPDHRPADRAAAAARAAALRRLGEHAGRAVGVGVVRYHLDVGAHRRGGGGGGGGKGGRRDGARGSAGCGRCRGSPASPRTPTTGRSARCTTSPTSPRSSAARRATPPPSSTAPAAATPRRCTATTLDTPPELEGALPVEVAARIELWAAPPRTDSAFFI